MVRRFSLGYYTEHDNDLVANVNWILDVLLYRNSANGIASLALPRNIGNEFGFINGLFGYDPSYIYTPHSVVSI